MTLSIGCFVFGNSADIQHKLEQELAQRPSPSELVNKGILNGELRGV